MTSDTNAICAALLRDLAELQPSKHSEWGYKRAAATIFSLDEPIESYVQPDGSLAKLPNIGPKSQQVILEVLRLGSSPTVERKVAESGNAAAIALARSLRDRFFSRARVLRILQDPTLQGPTPEDYRGDLQMHSVWSDGAQTLEEIVAAGVERGYRFCGVTDHSQGLKIARGASLEDFARQQREMEALNREQGDRLHLIKGVEANIRADGSIDLAPDEIQQFELVLAAPHSGLRSAEDQTQRLIRAIETRGVHVLAHPRGRMYGRRAGIIADWPAIFARAAAANVAIEIDGDPARQDIDYELAAAALDAGCLFALDSDAHAAGELRYAENAMAQARLAGIAVERVINCWPLERLLQWLQERA